MSDQIQVKPLDGEKYSRGSSLSVTVIPAGGTFGVDAYGERFYFVECTSPVEAKTDLTAYKPYRKGCGEAFTPDFRFKRIEIRNTNSYSVLVKIWTGFGEYIDTTSEITESPTVISGQTTSSLTAGQVVALSGAPSGVQIRRKNLVVSNLDTANILQILDSDDNVCCVVFASTSITLPVSGIIKVKNATAGAIACYISEIFYTYTP